MRRFALESRFLNLRFSHMLSGVASLVMLVTTLCLLLHLPHVVVGVGAHMICATSPALPNDRFAVRKTIGGIVTLLPSTSPGSRGVVEYDADVPLGESSAASSSSQSLALLWLHNATSVAGWAALECFQIRRNVILVVPGANTTSSSSSGWMVDRAAHANVLSQSPLRLLDGSSRVVELYDMASRFPQSGSGGSSAFSSASEALSGGASKDAQIAILAAATSVLLCVVLCVLAWAVVTRRSLRSAAEKSELTTDRSERVVQKLTSSLRSLSQTRMSTSRQPPSSNDLFEIVPLRPTIHGVAEDGSEWVAPEPSTTTPLAEVAIRHFSLSPAVVDLLEREWHIRTLPDLVDVMHGEPQTMAVLEAVESLVAAAPHAAEGMSPATVSRKVRQLHLFACSARP